MLAREAAGLGMLAWSPLASGWLTGKYRRGEPAPARTGRWRTPTRGCGSGTSGASPSRPGRCSTWYARWPTAAACPLSQVAIAWLMARPAVSSVILGARSMGQLTDNMAAAGLKLPAAEDIELLDEASEPPAPASPTGCPASPSAAGASRAADSSGQGRHDAKLSRTRIEAAPGGAAGPASAAGSAQTREIRRRNLAAIMTRRHSNEH